VIAVADCEVVRIDGTTAGAIASRNPVVADELNQLLASRNRRLDPLVASSEIDVPAATLLEALAVDDIDPGVGRSTS
jgi:hypothetical protein